jgi:hypothetical protein
MTSTFRATETKREEFRRYLDKGGALDTLTRRLILIDVISDQTRPSLVEALVALYEEGEKPNNPVEFVRRVMGANGGPEAVDFESIQNELAQIREKNEALTRENELLKEKLSKLEGS